MKHLLEMARLIESAGIAKEGEDLYLFTIPADVKNGVMLRGPLSGDPIDPELPDYFDSEFLVVVRDADPSTGHDRSQAISDLLALYEQKVGSIYVTRLYPRTKPIAYPRSTAGTVEWGIPFTITWGEPSS